MILYLVQHAEAKSEQEDPARPLSEKGWNDVARVGAFVRPLALQVEEILHSGKLRARQTAEALAESLGQTPVSETDGLSPLDDPHIWAGRLGDREGSLMLVGHLPHMARLASLLLIGSAERSAVSFRMGGILCLERDEARAWSVRWMVTPDILPA